MEKKMILKPADDFEKIKAGYIDVAEHTPEIAQHARWVYGKHPTDELLRSYIDRGEMYMLTDGDHIAGMVAVVMCQGTDYEAITWAENLANDQVATLHLLAILPGYRGQSLGRKILEEAAALAVRNGKKALRLDMLASNLPARRMYENAGFIYRGKQHWYAENTGWADFLLYEKLLGESAC
jgi:ribosomal protein S18 acetylase RimI-like enzyme